MKYHTRASESGNNTMYMLFVKPKEIKVQRMSTVTANIKCNLGPVSWSISRGDHSSRF